MPRRQLRLEVATIQELPARVRAECGPYAEIVAAEKVTVGGIRGFLARHHFEVTVSIPDAPRDGAHRLDLPARIGIAALLDDADLQESLIHEADTADPVSTRSAMFDELLGSLDFTEPAPARVVVPQPPAAPGDLMVLIGIGRDPLRVARAMAAGMGAAVCIAGAIAAPGAERVDDRRSSIQARAVGVRREHPTIVALGLHGAGDGFGDGATILRALAADQVWVAVDASRKADDTASWVEAMGAVAPIAALAVLGRGQTATPESTDALGLAVGWIDGGSVG